MATISRLSVSLTANTRRFRKGMGRAKRTLDGFVGAVFNAKTAIAGLVGAAGVGFAVKNLIEVNTRVETLKTSLKTMTGSAKEANKAFREIENFAKTTPFDLEQVVSGFIKLKSLGLDPSMKALRSYGNTASAMGKDLNQFIEAVADASTNEFERLKEFGIKSKQEGDKVQFTFQGISTTIKKTAEDIEGFLRNIGDTTFGSAMDDQADTLKTSLSNLGGAFVGLKTKIGEAGINDLVSEIAQTMTEWIESISKESVKTFADAVIGMAFTFARSMVSMVIWLGRFIDKADSLNTLWIKLKLGLSRFAQSALKTFGRIASGFTDMALEMWKNAGPLDKLFGIDEKGLIAMVEGTSRLKAAIGRLEQAQSKTTGALGNELAAQQRIDDSRRFDETLLGKIKKFEIGAEELFKNLEMAYSGEPVQQFGKQSAANPEDVKQTSILTQQLDLMKRFGFTPAKAG